MMTGTQIDEPAHTKLVFHQLWRDSGGTGTNASSSKTAAPFSSLPIVEPFSKCKTTYLSLKTLANLK